MEKHLNVAAIGTLEDQGSKLGSLGDLPEINLVWINSWTELNDLESIDVVITTLEWHSKWRITILESQSSGIPCFYIIDGILDWDYLWRNWEYIKKAGTAFQPLVSDRIGVVGNNQARLLCMLGLSSEIDLIGIPRLDKIQFGNDSKSDSNSTILVATATTPNLNSAGAAHLLISLKHLKSFFDENTQIEVKWRIAPEIAKKLSIACSDTETPIHEELSTVSAVISFSSTVLLESMLAGTPTALIDYRSVPSLVQTAWTIKSESDIPSIVRELLHPPPEKIAYQNFCLGDQLSYHNATNRLADSLFKLSEKESPFTEEQLSTQTPEGCLDFNQVHSHITSFSVGDAATLQYALDAYRSEALYNRKTLNVTLDKIDNYLKSPPGKFSRFIDKIPFLRSSYQILAHIKQFISAHL